MAFHSEFNLQRLDGRQFNEFRKLTIDFGNEWGCAFVSLGETRVLAQVSCELTQPRATRPTEGILYINVNSGLEKRSSEPVVLLTRNLERALKESRCVDLESLCVKAEEKVWTIRVDITILNHEGNLIGKLTKLMRRHRKYIHEYHISINHRLCISSRTLSLSTFQTSRCHYIR